MWEDLDDFRSRCPDFQLDDELDLDGGRDVMCGRDVNQAEERATAVGG
jgi:hypothetical protein